MQKQNCSHNCSYPLLLLRAQSMQKPMAGHQSSIPEPYNTAEFFHIRTPTTFIMGCCFINGTQSWWKQKKKYLLHNMLTLSRMTTFEQPVWGIGKNILGAANVKNSTFGKALHKQQHRQVLVNLSTSLVHYHFHKPGQITYLLNAIQVLCFSCFEGTLSFEHFCNPVLTVAPQLQSHPGPFSLK